MNDKGLSPLMICAAVRNEDIFDILVEEPLVRLDVKDKRGWDVCSYLDFYAVDDWKEKVSYCLEKESHL